MPVAATPGQVRFQKSFNLSAGKVFRRKDLADKHPSVDRELGLKSPCDAIDLIDKQRTQGGRGLGVCVNFGFGHGPGH